MTSSKARKILRRTLMGATLVVTLTLTLWMLSSSAHGKTLFYAVSVVLAVAVVELGRMGGFKARDFAPALALSALGTVLLLGAAIRDRERVHAMAAVPELSEFAYGSDLAVSYAWAGGLALVSFALYRVTQRALLSARLPIETGGWLAAVPRFCTYAAVACVIAFVTMDEFEAATRVRFALALFVVVALTSIPLLARERGGMTDLLWVTGLALWLIPPLPALWGVWHSFGLRALISLLVLSKIGDTAGYYVGTALGRTHPFPKISPGKTTAGCVGSFVAATALGGVFSSTGMLPPAAWGLGAGLVAGAVANIAAQAGDLLESWVKRRAGVKDSSVLFGPSGGMLDQIDSLLLSVPVCCVVWPWLFPASA